MEQTAMWIAFRRLYVLPVLSVRENCVMLMWLAWHVTIAKRAIIMLTIIACTIIGFAAGCIWTRRLLRRGVLAAKLPY